MRRMFSENQIKNLINQAIQNGEIKIKNYKHIITFKKADETKLVLMIKSNDSRELNKDNIEEILEESTWTPFNKGEQKVLLSVELPDIIYISPNEENQAIYLDYDVSDEGEGWSVSDEVIPL